MNALLLIFCSILSLWLTGCTALSGESTLYHEPSIRDRGTIAINRVAIVRNRLPAILPNAEYWIKRNWEEIASECQRAGVGVVDYSTSVQYFEESGLPTEDTKSSRDKYADLARKLNVDAIIIPYYAVMSQHSGGVVGNNEFTALMTIQIYLAKTNDFFTRIDASGQYSYQSGKLAVAGIISAIFQFAAPNIALIPDISKSKDAVLFLGIGVPIFNLASIILTGTIDGVSRTGSNQDKWGWAFNQAIGLALRRFFRAFPNREQHRRTGYSKTEALRRTLGVEPGGGTAPESPFSDHEADEAPPRPATPSCVRGDLQNCELQCRGGSAGSCYNLAMMYENGIGVPPDAEQMLRYYLQACDGGDASGCLRLVNKYIGGVDLPRDPARATTLALRACESRSREGCTRLQELLAGGHGTLEERARSESLLGQTCEQGNASACAQKRREEVRALTERACQEGNELACARLKPVKK